MPSCNTPLHKQVLTHIYFAIWHLGYNEVKLRIPARCASLHCCVVVLSLNLHVLYDSSGWFLLCPLGDLSGPWGTLLSHPPAPRLPLPLECLGTKIVVTLNVLNYFKGIITKTLACFNISLYWDLIHICSPASRKKKKNLLILHCQSLYC